MPDDVKTVSDYDRDFYTWALTQAEALRAAQAAVAQGRRNDWDNRLAALDWENLAEEIESLGKRDRRELASRIGTIIEHLAKLEFSPAQEPRAGWVDTVIRSRVEIEELLQESPSLRRQVPETVQNSFSRARRIAEQSLTRHGEEAAASVLRLAQCYTHDQILTDWWPEAAGPVVAPETDTPS